VEALEGRTLLAAGLLSEFSGPFSVPVDAIKGPDGNLWVLNQGEQGDSSLVVVGPDQSIKATYPIPTPGASAQALTVGPDGDVWFVEQGTDKIGKVTPSGDFTEYAIPPTMEDLGFGDGPQAVSAAPTDLVAGPDGAIWFTESGTDKVGRITTDGTITEVATPNLQPTSIAVGSDGDVWFTDTSSNGSIDRINADGSVTTFPLPSQFSWPTGLTLGPDGALWFAESLNQAVGRITTDGTITQTKIRADMPNPQRLAFDAAGDLWVTGSGSGLVRVAPGGLTTAFGPADSAVGNIAAVTTGPDGAIWFTDTGRDQIGRIDPAQVSAAPTDHPLTASAPPLFVNSSTGQPAVSGAVATFYDGNPSGVAGDFTATIDWGDGATSAGSISATGDGQFQVSGDHTYAALQLYTVAVTITDTNPAHTPQPNQITVTTPVTMVVLSGPPTGGIPLPPVGQGVGVPVVLYGGSSAHNKVTTPTPKPKSAPKVTPTPKPQPKPAHTPTPVPVAQAKAATFPSSLSVALDQFRAYVMQAQKPKLQLYAHPLVLHPVAPSTGLLGPSARLITLTARPALPLTTVHPLTRVRPLVLQGLSRRGW
jgi:virginiamycin B lyase